MIKHQGTSGDIIIFGKQYKGPEPSVYPEGAPCVPGSLRILCPAGLLLRIPGSVRDTVQQRNRCILSQQRNKGTILPVRHKCIREPGIRDIDLLICLKDHLPAHRLFRPGHKPGPFPDLCSGDRILDQFKLHHTSRRLCRFQRKVQHIYEFRMETFHRPVCKIDILLHR